MPSLVAGSGTRPADAAPVTETVVRVSCGGAHSVPLVRVTNLARAMERLKELGVWIVGTADETTQSLYDIDLKGPIAIVMGAVQALVFALLAAVYLYMAQPHHEEEHRGAEEHGAQPAHA